MMFRTHFIFGILAGLVFLRVFNIPNEWLFMLVVAIGASLPDIDFHKSKIGGWFKPLAYLFNFLLGHRGVIHSLVGAFIIYFIFMLFFGSTYAGAVFIGYSSHLFLDSFTPKGIRPFWPLKPKVNGIVRSGGMIEMILFFLFLVTVLLMLA
ncbi:metal-dependent hydrolase [Candidatus Woesearchaeota archaeon]|jgi:inner membrane protein|nr:metal-dependent hydrolase [Candidatus Woesearchaeota archaeon]